MSPTTTAYDYDLIVVGSGPAGEKAAIQAAKLDKRVAVIERGSLLGGACTHTATLPSKTLREAVLFIAGLEQRSFPGIQCAVKKHRMGVQDLLRYKTAVVQHQADAVRRKLDRNDIDVFHGEATFLDPHRLAIESSDGARRTCTAAVMILAIGSRLGGSPTSPSRRISLARRSVSSASAAGRSRMTRSGGRGRCARSSYASRSGSWSASRTSTVRPA